MQSNQIEEIEINITRAKEIISKGDSLERLLNNRDFKKVVIEGYFEKEAIRLVHLKSDYNSQTPDAQADIDNDIMAVGRLSKYFNEVFRQAELSRKAVAEDEETREDLLSEGIE